MRKPRLPVVTTEMLYESFNFIVTLDRADGEPLVLLVVNKVEQPDDGTERPALFATLEGERLAAFQDVVRRWQASTPEQAEVEAFFDGVTLGAQPLHTH